MADMRLIKTETGQLAFKERSPLISARQRSMYILFDGQKTVAQVLAATAGLGVTQADVDSLMAAGFLASSEPLVATPDAAAPLASDPGAPRDVGSEQERYKNGKVIATQLTASLGLRGFMLNLSVESAAGYDDLLKLLPKIQAAVGEKAARELERILKG